MGFFMKKFSKANKIILILALISFIMVGVVVVQFFMLRTTLSDGKVVDGVVHQGEEGETHRVYYKFRTEGTHTIRAVYYKQGNYYLSQEKTINIVDNGYSITPLFPSSMYYMQDDFTAKLTYAKNPVPNDDITFYVNGLTYSKPTDANGIARLNNRLPPNAESEGRSQDYDSDNNVYNVHMQHSTGGNIDATADKQTKINRPKTNL